MTIERIDYWDRCLGTGQFDSAIQAVPDEAKAFFGADALNNRDPTTLALIIFARRVLLMTDDQIAAMDARIRQEASAVGISESDGFQHYCIPIKEGNAITPLPIVALSCESLVSAKNGTHVGRVREMAKQILLRNGLDPMDATGTG